ncbi:hypothetical protein, partial [Scytonema sp. PCC 10023]|uniref:hypothetical protein n=1 Tax=Scytonema sp. PCC 10023 TaxID=1680591 RepID=UPI0039C60004
RMILIAGRSVSYCWLLQLGAGTIAEIKSILDQLGRPTTEPISSEDFDILRGIFPLIKEGMSLEDALAKLSVREASRREGIAVYNQQPEPLPEQPAPSIQEMLATARQEFIATGVEDSLRKDVKSFYLLYFEMWGDALKSPEILQDPEVKAACKGAISSTLEAMEEINGNFLASFRSRLRTKGFLPSVVNHQPQLQETVEVEIESVA